MATVGSVVVEIVGESRSLEDAITKSKKTLTKFAETTKSVGKSALEGAIRGVKSELSRFINDALKDITEPLKKDISTFSKELGLAFKRVLGDPQFRLQLIEAIREILQGMTEIVKAVQTLKDLGELPVLSQLIEVGKFIGSVGRVLGEAGEKTGRAAFSTGENFSRGLQGIQQLLGVETRSIEIQELQLQSLIRQEQKALIGAAG